jgi:quercetin dioxygenase-like cupin family protein
MRMTMLAGAIILSVLGTCPSEVPADEVLEQAPPTQTPVPMLENLLRAHLERVEGTEVIVSRVTIPPNTALPKHWHPGEEFAYILEGSAILWQEGKEDIVGRAGDVLRVPLEQVHTAVTEDEGATILVFRVHEAGKPERVMVGVD